MLIIVSPAKSIRKDFKSPQIATSLPDFHDQAFRLIKKLKKLSPKKLEQLFKVNPKIAGLNYDRFQQFIDSPQAPNSLPAAFAFIGDVYRTLEIETFTDDDLRYAQDHFRILSGMYGVLRPLDMIQAYRLEMGTKLKSGRHENLYSFWKLAVNKHIQEQLKMNESNLIINLASNEYFKAVDTKKLKVEIVTPIFKDFSQGKYKVMGLFAKRARGAMSSYLIKNRITDPEMIKLFDWDGYYYSDEQSTANEIVFTRG